MENNQSQNQENHSGPKADPNLIYPSAQPSQQPAEAVATTQSVPETQNGLSLSTIIIIILLVLTFFSPLGSILFLPLVVVGIYSAARYVNKNSNSHGKTPKNTQQKTLMIFAKTVMVVGIVISVGFLALIALLFLAVAGAFGEFRMGS